MPLASHAAAEPLRDTSQVNAVRPLVIDGDRTFMTCDLARETLVSYLKLNPDRLFDVLGWLGRGRSAVKRELAQRVVVDVDKLPVNEALTTFAKEQAAAGRHVYLLVSLGSPLRGAIKARFPFITGVLERVAAGSSNATAAADDLARRFPEGFDYAGSSGADLDIWKRARSAILVDPSPRVRRRVAAVVPIAITLPGPSRAAGLLVSLRLHQWVKNLLVFAPMVLGGQVADGGALQATVVAFLALGLVASSTYLINDILDVADDRQHWSKRERPIAKGQLRASAAAVWAGVGLVAGLGLGATVSSSAVAVLLLYVGLTLSYSLGLKRLPLIDGLVLAVQFTLRLALGVVASQVPPSPWLFVFSMFFFTSLSLAKRYTELGRLSTVQLTKIAGRGYRTEDMPLVLAIGVAAGLGAVIIVILYIIDDAFRQSFYGATAWLWGFPALIFLLVCRIWLVTVRGEMHDDPVKFMLADRVSQAVLAMLVICFAFAWLA